VDGWTLVGVRVGWRRAKRKDEGDRKGLRPTQPHPRPYNERMNALVNRPRSHCKGGGGWMDEWGPLRSPWDNRYMDMPFISLPERESYPPFFHRLNNSS
jgi:hypothetical protein